MENSDYIKQAVEIADVIRREYDNFGRNANFSLWGVSFCWDGKVLDGDRKENPFSEFVPELLGRLDEVVRPGHVPARARSRLGHYSALCNANRDAIEEHYKKALEEAGYSGIDEVMEIVTDAKLANEAARSYISLKKEGELGAEDDIIRFILRYDMKKGVMGNESRKPNGTYSALADRMVQRYGIEGIEKGLFGLLNSDIAEEAERIHYESIPKPADIAVSPGLSRLHSQYVKENGDTLPPEPAEARGVGLIGRRKVVRRGGCGRISWADIEERHRMRRVAYRAFEPNDVVRARIERAMSDSFLNLYKLHGNIEEVLGEIDSAAESAESDEERQILARVRKKFVMIGRFDELDINHEMPVTIRRRNGNGE